MKSKFCIIEEKLNDFIRKFYSNRIVIGVLLFILIAVISFFSVSMIESVAFMSPTIKTILFYFLLFLLASVFIVFILLPLGKLTKLLPYISYDEASNIISNHFHDDNELLLSILQLNRGESNDFLVASINQKIDSISPFNFNNAIDFKKTMKFFGVSCGTCLLLIILCLIFQTNFTSGATRFMNYNTFYQPENPYSLSVVNSSLDCPYGDDFKIQIHLSGPSVPNDVFLNNDILNVRMNIDSTGYYSYTFKSVTQDIDFSFNYLDFYSDNFNLSVYYRPQVTNFVATITPPSYTGIETSEFEINGDFTVPFGSKINWKFDLSHSNDFNFYIDSVSCETKFLDNSATVSKTATRGFDYSFSVLGENETSIQSNLFHVNIIPDYAPQILAVSTVDSTVANAIFFSGHIADDYGFHSLSFNYFDSNSPKDIKTIPIELQKGVAQDFYYYFDFSNLSKSVSYYFEVKDNDAISGFKSTKTPLSVYTTITNEEKQERVDNLNSSIFDKIEESQRLLRELNSDLDDFQKNVSSNGNISDYEKQLKLDNLMEKQQRLQDLLNDLSQDNQSKNAFENQLSPEMAEELLQRQKLLQEMWDELMNDDIKDLLNKINEMAKSINEKNLRDNISDFRFNLDQISEQLDRNSDLMKMYNIDNILQNLSKDLKDISKDYKQMADELSEQSDKPDKSKNKDSKKNDNNSRENASENQNNQNSEADSKQEFTERMEQLKQQFEKKAQEYQELLKQNEELGNNKLDIKNLDKKFDDVKSQLQYEQNQLENLSPNDKNKQKPDEKNTQNSNSSRETNDKDNLENASENQENLHNQENQNQGENQDPKVSQQSHQMSDSDKKVSDNSDKQNSQNNDSKNQNSNENSEKSDKNDNKNSENSRQNQQQRQQLSQQIEETAEQIEELSDEMQGINKKNKQKQHKENLNDIRQILDNLVTISFNQEQLIHNIKQNPTNSYLTGELLKQQISVQKDFALVQDSIYALAKRVPELGHSVYDKVDNIHGFFTKIFSAIDNNRRQEVMNNQQFLLTNVNDLSLLFAEIADQMQNQPQNQNGEPNDSEEEQQRSKNKKEMMERQQQTQQMKNQQQSLKQNLQNLLQQLQKGEQISSQKLAESLRQQEMMMQKLQELKNGKGLSTEEQKLLNQIGNLMEENKRDIVNRNINQRLIDRQNTLFNKLLDLENAEKSNEQDDKRESKQGVDLQNNNQNKLNLRLKDFGVKEFIYMPPVNLQLFYQNMYNEYIQNID